MNDDTDVSRGRGAKEGDAQPFAKGLSEALMKSSAGDEAKGHPEESCTHGLAALAFLARTRAALVRIACPQTRRAQSKQRHLAVHSQSVVSAPP